MTYGDLMDDLSSAWRKVDAPEQPSRNDCGWVHTLEFVFDELEALGLSSPTDKPAAKKRGRPKMAHSDKPKKPRGRPKKNSSLN